MSITLGEVTVTAKAKNWYKDFEHNAEKIADLDSLDPTGNRFENLFDLLFREFEVQEYTFNNPRITTPFLPSQGGPSFYLPIYIINGSVFLHGSEPREILYSRLNSLKYFPVKEIKRIMVLPPSDLSVFYKGDMRSPIWQSIVYIETYSDLTYRGDPRGVKTFLIDGLDAPRQFYSPRYEGPARNSPGYDGRVTLYWNPAVRTDAAGQTMVDFFTSDRKTTLEVIVNGIEMDTGNPGNNRLLINYH
jgi:hypothetical protein